VADVNLNIGTDSSHISGSNIDVGSVAGGDVVNVHSGGRSRLDQLNDRLDLINTRLGEVEQLLEGKLGTRGLVWRLDNVIDTQEEIRKQLQAIQVKERVTEDRILAKLDERPVINPMTIIYLSVSTFLFISSVFLILVLPRL